MVSVTLSQVHTTVTTLHAVVPFVFYLTNLITLRLYKIGSRHQELVGLTKTAGDGALVNRYRPLQQTVSNPRPSLQLSNDDHRSPITGLQDESWTSCVRGDKGRLVLGASVLTPPTTKNPLFSVDPWTESGLSHRRWVVY